MGRPSKDLHVVIGVLLLQQLHDLSDAETVEALAFNMAWHYALDVRSEADSYFCEKTLRNYRRLFIEQGLDGGPTGSTIAPAVKQVFLGISAVFGFG